ncbi:MAG: chromosomal replication initiator protein DnaA [Desulfamplus sp.]|nr:chromosomal replication initiator protein DnaA [Desulfamplus sp.]
MESVWNQVKANLKELLPDHSFRMWIQPIQFLNSQPLDSAGSVLVTLTCPNSFSKKRVKENYISGITQEFLKLSLALGISDVHLAIDIANSHKVDVDKIDNPKVEIKKDCCPKKEPRKINKIDDQLPLPGLPRIFDTGRMLKKDYTFDQFVVGNSNDFAYSASLSLAQGGNNANKAIYLLAGTGLGKSHLSQAVGHHVINQGITNKVFYITAEDFTNEMVNSIQNQTISNFKEKYRKKCEVLILEDIHFLSGKEATQKELAVTLDHLLDADKKIIFSGCYLPDDIPKMNDQLKSRLTMGLVTKIEAPDFSTRFKIVKKKSEINGYNIPNDVAEYIAQELCDNVRQLESGLTGVVAKGSLMGEKIDLTLARQVIENISKSKKEITIDAIKKLICTEFGISEFDLISTSRKAKLVHPRQMAIYLSRKYTDQPIKIIGKSFNRYHATAIHSINAVEKAIQQQGALCEQLNYLYKKIETGKI